ncbi:hypothetical protein V5O48_013211 [Marasmius crinis-equi]|uniref:Uncharacterized protein n=1 Tax=Marasmius crinis-equi TaxID=585013 RepID=A0ABR3F0Q6_9AGAR
MDEEPKYPPHGAGCRICVEYAEHLKKERDTQKIDTSAQMEKELLKLKAQAAQEIARLQGRIVDLQGEQMKDKENLWKAKDELKEERTKRESLERALEQRQFEGSSRGSSRRGSPRGWIRESRESRYRPASPSPISRYPSRHAPSPHRDYRDRSTRRSASPARDYGRLGRNQSSPPHHRTRSPPRNDDEIEYAEEAPPRPREVPMQVTAPLPDRPQRPTLDTSRIPPTAPRAIRSAGHVHPATEWSQPTTAAPQIPPRGLAPGSRPTRYRAGNERAYISDSGNRHASTVPTLNSLPRLPSTAQPMAIPSTNSEVDRTLQSIRNPVGLDEVIRLQNLISSLHGRAGLGDVLTPSARSMLDAWRRPEWVQDARRMLRFYDTTSNPPDEPYARIPPLAQPSNHADIATHAEWVAIHGNFNNYPGVLVTDNLTTDALAIWACIQFRQLVPSNRNNSNSQRARGRWISLFIELMTQPYLYEQLLQLFNITVDAGGCLSHFDGVDVNFTMQDLVAGLASRGITARHSYWMYSWAMQYLREGELLNRDTGYVREVPWTELLGRAGHRVAEVGPPPIEGLPFEHIWTPPDNWDIPQYRDERNRRLAAAGKLDKANKRKQGIKCHVSHQPSYVFPPPLASRTAHGSRAATGNVPQSTASPAVSREYPSPAVSREGVGMGSNNVPLHLISGLSSRHPAHAQRNSSPHNATTVAPQTVPTQPTDDDSVMHDGTQTPNVDNPTSTSTPTTANTTDLENPTTTTTPDSNPNDAGDTTGAGRMETTDG